MADDLDRTQERMEAYEPFLIQNSRKPEGPKPTGSCHYCGDPVEGTARFCDKDCRDDWTLLYNAGRIA